jgi:asparagine synthase (glutamine-hydrolysing)
MGESLRGLADASAIVCQNGPSLRCGSLAGGIGFAPVWHVGPQGLTLCLYGEVYRYGGSTGIPLDEVAGHILSETARGSLAQALRNIDGEFCAVLSDPARDEVHIMVDRYGLRPLYWFNKDGLFAWATGVRALLEVPGNNLEVSKVAAQQMWEIGHLLGDQTWFSEAKALPPGSVLTFRGTDRRAALRKYWSWGDLPSVRAIDFDRAVDQFGQLFKDSVRVRAEHGGRVGVTLSGGLDSRAILAATPQTDMWTGSTFTFGRTDCLDERIASRVARKARASHTFLELNETNWLGPRIPAVWWTDGQLDIHHMHGVEFADVLRKRFDVNLLGFMGEALAGGFYLRSPDMLDCPISAAYAASFMKCSESLLDDLPEYASLEKSDFYFVDNRQRRWILNGTFFGASGIMHRKPFCDNTLVEFLFSLPDSYRFESRIYKAMLLRFFPSLFRHIEWQRTQEPISWSSPRGAVQRRRVQLERKARRVLSSMRQGSLPAGSCFTDYPQWLSSEPAWSFTREFLSSASCTYRQWLPGVDSVLLIEEHSRGIDRSDQLLRLLTMEVWLRQIDDKDLRFAGW